LQSKETPPDDNGINTLQRLSVRAAQADAKKTEAGRAMLMSADMVVWESNAALVARVELFLQKGFSWYSRNPKPARETLQTLLGYVRDGAVIVSEESGATTDVFGNGGFTFDPPAREERRNAPPLDYDARGAENRASLRDYNDAIDARVERERSLNTPSFEEVKPSDMPFLLSLVRMVTRGENLRREAMQKAASGFSEVADDAKTPLGDAVPFEYVKSATSDDVLSIAARGVSEAQESICLAAYESALDLCGVLAFPMGGARGVAVCKANAFDRYQQCRGY
jgi:hypothetical protein